MMELVRKGDQVVKTTNAICLSEQYDEFMSKFKEDYRNMIPHMIIEKMAPIVEYPFM